MTTREELIKVFTAIKDEAEMAAFFEEIFTSKELDDIALRWQLLRDLHDGETQRSIAQKYRISLCKITRGSKILKKQPSTTRNLLEQHYGKEEEK
ncbi:MAG: Trp family transcriptional regulator [Thermodesulfobacteriota bacterium]